MKRIFVLLFCLVIQCSALDTNFVKAIHKVETGGRVGMIWGDSRKSLGPLQISRSYWQDAMQFDKSIGGKFEDVQRLEYAQKIMEAYLKRYCPREVNSGNFEAMARAHNSGPKWKDKLSKTDDYWAKVKRELKK